MDWEEILWTGSARAAEAMQVLARRLQAQGIRHALLGGLPQLGGLLEVVVEASSRDVAIVVAESIGFTPGLTCVGQSHHRRDLVELRFHYLERTTFERVINGAADDGAIVLANHLDNPTYFALLSESTRGLPAEITPADAEPFTL